MEVPCVESLKNVTGYKGTLRTVIARQEQEKTLAKIKNSVFRKTRCQRHAKKIVAMTLDDKRDELSNEALVKEQKP